MTRGRSKIAVVAACGAVILASRGARASDFSIEGEVMRGNPVFVIPVGLDVAFTVYDAAMLINDDRGHQVAAIAETAVALPQFLYCSVLLAANAKSQVAIGPGLMALWTGALVTHGAIVLIQGPPADAPQPAEDPTTPKEEHPHIGFVPTLLGDGARSALVPGVVAVGTF